MNLIWLLFGVCCIELAHSTRSLRANDSPQSLKRLRRWRLYVYSRLRPMIDSDRNKKILLERMKLQPKVDPSTPFFCSLNNTRSLQKPSSVHKLRPGDIDIVGAIGDSLSVGVGLTATRIRQVYFENREISPTAGGRSNWREFLTIPNILKEFNPNLKGYSKQASITILKESQFNIAETGAMSSDIPHMAKLMVKRMNSHPGINFKEDWKMISMMIGPNDFCANVCYQRSLKEVLENHKKDLIKTLRILRDNIPRVFVNLIPAPNLRTLIDFIDRPIQCYLNHLFVCPCLIGEQFKKRRDELIDFMTKWQDVELEVAEMKEFDLDNFTVVVQPFTRGLVFPTTWNNKTDYSFLSEDCFHFSQKGNAMIANSIWNNMLEPVGNKSLRETKLFSKLLCPTEENPFIFTIRNSRFAN